MLFAQSNHAQGDLQVMNAATMAVKPYKSGLSHALKTTPSPCWTIRNQFPSQDDLQLIPARNLPRKPLCCKGFELPKCLPSRENVTIQNAFSDTDDLQVILNRKRPFRPLETLVLQGFQRTDCASHHDTSDLFSPWLHFLRTAIFHRFDASMRPHGSLCGDAWTHCFA